MSRTLDNLSNIDPKTGKKILFDYSDYERTHVPAVDFVAQVVGYNRHKLIPVKAIYLKKRLYDQFFAWTLAKACEMYGKKAGEEKIYDTIARGRALEFDSVDIRELNSAAEQHMKYSIGKQHTKNGSYMERLGNSGWIEVFPQVIVPEKN